MGADFYCLHKNRWWQTSRGPLLDAGAFVAGLEEVRDGRRGDRGRQAEPDLLRRGARRARRGPELTWLVGDDAESDVRAAQLFGMRTLVRTGKFRPDTLERLDVTPDVVLSSIADTCPTGSSERLTARPMAIRVGTDLIEIDRIRLALDRPGVPRPAASPPTSRRTARRRNGESYAARFCGKEAVGKALGSAGCCSRGRRSRSSAPRSPV